MYLRLVITIWQLIKSFVSAVDGVSLYQSIGNLVDLPQTAHRWFGANRLGKTGYCEISCWEIGRKPGTWKS